MDNFSDVTGPYYHMSTVPNDSTHEKYIMEMWKW